MRPKQNRPAGEVRVRHEPPTLDEAIFAAQGLSDDLEEQTEIAAMLMGLPETEVRPSVQKAAEAPLRPSGPRAAAAPRPMGVAQTSLRRPGRQTVIVERRTSRLSAR